MDGTQTSQYRCSQAHGISGALGAEISGVDLSRPADDAFLAEIHRHPFIARMPDYPEVLELAEKPGDRKGYRRGMEL